jgi:hypothetical protein
MLLIRRENDPLKNNETAGQPKNLNVLETAGKVIGGTVKAVQKTAEKIVNTVTGQQPSQKKEVPQQPSKKDTPQPVPEVPDAEEIPPVVDVPVDGPVQNQEVIVPAQPIEPAVIGSTTISENTQPIPSESNSSPLNLSILFGISSIGLVLFLVSLGFVVQKRRKSLSGASLRRRVSTPSNIFYSASKAKENSNHVVGSLETLSDNVPNEVDEIMEPVEARERTFSLSRPVSNFWRKAITAYAPSVATLDDGPARFSNTFFDADLPCQASVVEYDAPKRVSMWANINFTRLSNLLGGSTNQNEALKIEAALKSAEFVVEPAAADLIPSGYQKSPGDTSAPPIDYRFL